MYNCDCNHLPHALLEWAVRLVDSTETMDSMGALSFGDGENGNSFGVESVDRQHNHSITYGKFFTIYLPIGFR